MPQHPPDGLRPAHRGLAEIVLESRAGRTRLARCRTRPPLLVQQTLYLDDAMPDMAFVFLANPTGGLLQNDRQEISVSVGSGAKAHVTTQSATKIHTTIDGVAKQHVELTVKAGGYLEYLPDPLIPFKDANLEQRVTINLEPGAALVYGDVISPGRVAMGEAFQYRNISSRLAVYRQHGHPVYVEAFDVTPINKHPMSMAVLGVSASSEPNAPNVNTFASMLVLCDAAYARSILDLLRGSLSGCIGVKSGASILPDGNGVGVKVIGSDRAAVQTAAAHAWSAARHQLLGVAMPCLRKY